MYQIHAKLKIGKEMVSNSEPVAFSVRLSSSGHVRGVQYENVQLLVIGGVLLYFFKLSLKWLPWF